MDVTLAVVFPALFVAHQLGDHIVQTHHQACTKGQPGAAGRWACIRHVATYTLTAVVCLLAAIAVTGASVSPAAFTAGLTISAVSHYIADRRAPLRWFAAVTGHAAFFDLGAARPGRDDNPCLGTGAYAMDQAWHYGWLFVAALVMA